MAIFNLRNVGQVKPEYVLPRFESRYNGVSFDAGSDTPTWIVKNYQLFNKAKNESPDNFLSTNQVYVLIQDAIERRKLTRQIGLGFAVVSRDILNLSLWREDFPHLPKQTLWVYNGEAWTMANLAEDNSYCIGEGAIYAHERDAWQKFLGSSKKEKDKMDYLDSILKNGPTN
jgi:hypothetical protein